MSRSLRTALSKNLARILAGYRVRREKFGNIIEIQLALR